MMLNDNDSIRNEYIGRINKVIVHIENNLNEELPLSKMSEIACFSPYHFHRIFSVITGETLNSFITRIRLERTASLLLNKTDTPLKEIGFKYGFNSATSFSRAFKKHYGISPSEFMQNSKGNYSKIGIDESKIGKAKVTFEEYICNINNIIKWINMNAKVEVKEMPEINLVYMSHVGDYEKIGGVYEKLFRWAGPKGILGSPQMKTITVYHDDPKVTKISQVRQSAGIAVDRDIVVDGEVGKMTVPGGKYAVGRFEISETEFGTAWNSMCVWVAENGYKDRDGLYYELYHNDHMQHPERKFILDICVPVE